MSTGAVGLLVAAGVAAATHAQAATSVSCPVCATIFGTNDGETINGTSGDDIICAGAGNDAIDGRVGNDRIYAGGGDDVIVAGAGNDAIFAGSGGDRVSAGAGADVIYGDNPVGMVYFDPADTGADGNDVIDGGPGSDPIDGGAGNDIIFTGGDGSTRPSASITHGRPGNDVLVSDFRQPTLAEYFYGDAGSDLLWPNPLRLAALGNTVIGGAGNDAIIMLNALPDVAHMGDLATTVRIPLGQFCAVSVPLPDKLVPGSTGRLSCNLPLGVTIPGVTQGMDLKVSVDTSGKATGEVTVKPSQLLADVSEWVALARGGFPREMCICDTKLPGWAAVLGDTVCT